MPLRNGLFLFLDKKNLNGKPCTDHTLILSLRRVRAATLLRLWKSFKDHMPRQPTFRRVSGCKSTTKKQYAPNFSATFFKKTAEFRRKEARERRNQGHGQRAGTRGCGGLMRRPGHISARISQESDRLRPGFAVRASVTARAGMVLAGCVLPASEESLPVGTFVPCRRDFCTHRRGLLSLQQGTRAPRMQLALPCTGSMVRTAARYCTLQKLDRQRVFLASPCS